ncbi:hypothetical protein MKX01_013571 [Papaver californicum]|nr:hypothetical protein MKX01_013571 [Papaver californicum]
MSNMMGRLVKKNLGEMGFNMGGGPVNWFPGHTASATRAIRDRLKLADHLIEVRDACIPLSSVNGELLLLNKKDLANPNIMHRWTGYFESLKQDCMTICICTQPKLRHEVPLINFFFTLNVSQLLEFAELKLKEVISREPTLLIMVVGVPNVGKSSLINCIHQIKLKRATMGPLPAVVLIICGRLLTLNHEHTFAHHPSIYVLATPGILIPSIPFNHMYCLTITNIVLVNPPVFVALNNFNTL